MERQKSKLSKAKLIMGIVIPMLAIVVTMIVTGITFAWFNQTSVSRVATLNLSSQRVFVLEFTVDADSPYERLYAGETAIGKDGHLVTDAWARESGLVAGSEQWDAYTVDAPYYFKTTIALDTQNIPVDMSLAFDNALIRRDTSGVTEYKDSYGVAAPSQECKVHDVTAIPYAFTWYFTKTGDSSTMYTPYGKLELDAQGFAKSLNGELNVTSIADKSPIALNEFIAHSDTTYDFYIVFAPQKLYWMQYFSADWKKTVSEVYSNGSDGGVDEIGEIMSAISPDQMYYSAISYFGSTFEFTATVEVTHVHWYKEVGA